MIEIKNLVKSYSNENDILHVPYFFLVRVLWQLSEPPGPVKPLY